METEYIYKNGQEILSVYSKTAVLTNVDSALDLIGSLYGRDCNKIAVNLEALSPDFFVLRTGLAGEILQKFTNYEVTLAIYGDFSGFTSPPLKAFMEESNRGTRVFFMPDLSAATEKLIANLQ